MEPTPTVQGLLLSRRAALATVALTPLAACTADESRSARRSPQPPEADPDVAVAAAALAGHQAMLERLRATQQRHPGLAQVLGSLASAHQQHVDVLAQAVPTGADPSAPRRPAPTRPAVPGDARKAVHHLVRAERALGTATKRHAFAARSGGFARVLGSMAAASAQFAAVLESTPAPPAARR